MPHLRRPLDEIGKLASWNTFATDGRTITVEAAYQEEASAEPYAIDPAYLSEPVEISNGWLAQGAHRYALARATGLTSLPVIHVDSGQAAPVFDSP